MTAETRTFIGLEGYAEVYVLHFEQLKDGRVSIELNHAREGAGPLVVSGAQFKE